MFRRLCINLWSNSKPFQSIHKGMLEVYPYLDEPQLHNNIYQAAKMWNGIVDCVC